MSPRRRWFAPVSLVCAVGLTLSGCGAWPGSGTTAPPSSSAPPSASVGTEATPETDLAAVDFTDALGRNFEVHSVTPAQVVEDDDRVVVSVTLHSPDDVLTLTAPDGATWGVESDSSVLLRDDATTTDGVAVFGGLASPKARDVNNSSVRVVVRLDDAAPERALEYALQPRGTTQFPVQLEVRFAAQAVDRLEWAAELEGGESLQVFPTSWGRSGSNAAVQAVWESIIAQEPGAETDVMHNQLRCHALGAPDKASWNLEPWRPDVPYLDYLLARCNPS